MHTIDASFGMPHLPLRNYLEVTVANPLNGCTQLEEGQRHLETLVVVQRGDCTFAQKVAFVQSTGAIGVLVVNNDDKMITLMVRGQLRSVLNNGAQCYSTSDNFQMMFSSPLSRVLVLASVHRLIYWLNARPLCLRFAGLQTLAVR